MTITTVVVSPSSTGSVTLSSRSPFDFPTIDPAFLTTSFDVYAMRSAIRSAVRFVSARTWDGYITGQAASFASVDLNSDAEVDAWARSQASTMYHPTGTARMGRCADKHSVADPDLRLKGTKGLRGGVFYGCCIAMGRFINDDRILQPFIPAAHTGDGICV